jgi:hypothetical protein
MSVDMRAWLNSETVSALDLIHPDGGRRYVEKTVTIDRISEPELVRVGPKKERLPCAYFHKAKKKMILRPVHLREIVRAFGPDPTKAAGQKVVLWVELDVRTPQGPADCVRIRVCNGSKPASRPAAQSTRTPEAPAPEPAISDDELTRIVVPLVEKLGDDTKAKLDEIAAAAGVASVDQWPAARRDELEVAVEEAILESEASA